MAETAVGWERLPSQLSPEMQRLFGTAAVKPFAPLFKPGPLSIINMPGRGNENRDSNEIFVAGRFPSILQYDRRSFPKLQGTLHSGARLCSMVSLPHPFSPLNAGLLRKAELTIEQVDAAKKVSGNTLIACGEYNSKGSLELYGLKPPSDFTSGNDNAASTGQHSTLKNRQTSSSSKLLSVANHGTRIVVSDCNGNIRFFERDGFTEVRRWNISHGSVEAPRGIFGSLGDSYMDSGSGDIVRKILPTGDEHVNRLVNDNDLLLWTGEKIGLMKFTSKPGFNANDFEEVTQEEQTREREQRIYSETMRRALERQADEVRFVAHLGQGTF